MKESSVPKNYLDRFKSKLEGLGPLSESAWTAFSARMTYVSFEKDEVLIEEGQIEDKIYMLLQGVVRVYVCHQGKEICTNFGFDGQFTSSITSFLTQRPSQYWIRTQVASEFLAFNYSDLNWLYQNFIEINRLGRVVMEVLLIEKRERELDLLILSAEERYNKLLRDHPGYVQKIPLKHLASYLGVTAESLSRIRAKQG